MSKSTAITKFAGQMITDHTATTAKLKSITAGDAALKPPAAMDEKHQQLLADLKARQRRQVRHALCRSADQSP